MKRMNKRGEFGLGGLQNVALVFLLAGVFFAVALVILSSLATNLAASSALQIGGGNTNLSPAGGSVLKVVNSTITAGSEIPNNWLLLIAVIVAAAVVITIVIASMGKGTGRE